MRPQTLASCANCWFNGLQYGSVGLSIGYCVEHKLILRRSDETTCKRHMRKDFLLPSARRFQQQHQKVFSKDEIVALATGEILNVAKNRDYVDDYTAFFRSNSIESIVADYGVYDTKIESLAQLFSFCTFRSELAMLSLGRAYTDRCVERGGDWTSGINLFWWIKKRLLQQEMFALAPADFRYSATTSLERQVELAEWSLLMLRLTFISDLGMHSQGSSDSIDALQEIAEQAALATEIPSKRKLLAWIKKIGNPMLEQAMPESRYRQIRDKLRTLSAGKSSTPASTAAV